MVDVKAEFLKSEKEVDRLASVINDEVSFDRFVTYCDLVVNRVQRYFEDGYAPVGVKLSLEALMYRIIFKKLMVLKRDSNLQVAFQVTQSLFRNRFRTALVANLRNFDVDGFLTHLEIKCATLLRSL